MTAALPGRRPPRRLRTQLTAVVVLTALALALALGLVSTLALRSSLLERIDAQLVAASDRGRDVLPSGGTPVPLPTPDAAGPAGDGPAGDDPAAGDPAAGDQGDGPTPNGFPGTGIPPGLAVRGQAAGTVVVEVRGGEVVDAGYLDETGAVVELTAAQADALLAATAQPGWVDVPGLGRYRAVAAERPTRPAGGADDAGSTGDVAVTALPWSDAAATLERYVVVEVIVGSLAVVL
ncbi:MAG: hypothetical protein J0H73_09530, partial [Salana multivorans]|nr:hypothetical protein [Salana multivorans]